MLLFEQNFTYYCTLCILDIVLVTCNDFKCTNILSKSFVIEIFKFSIFKSLFLIKWEIIFLGRQSLIENPRKSSYYNCDKDLILDTSYGGNYDRRLIFIFVKFWKHLLKINYVFLLQLEIIPLFYYYQNKISIIICLIHGRSH